MAWVNPRCNDIVAHLAAVKAEVGDVAGTIAVRARARLAAHRYTGASRIAVTRQDTDRIVWLVDKAAWAIEGGHTTKHGRRVAGLRIVTGAADSLPTV